MRTYIAKSLQALGLVIVALALAVGLESDDMGRELAILAGGAAVFLAGWAVAPRSA